MQDATITIYDPQECKHRLLAVAPRQYADVVVLGVDGTARYLETAHGASSSELTRLSDRRSERRKVG